MRRWKESEKTCRLLGGRKRAWCGLMLRQVEAGRRRWMMMWNWVSNNPAQASASGWVLDLNVTLAGIWIPTCVTTTSNIDCSSPFLTQLPWSLSWALMSYLPMVGGRGASNLPLTAMLSALIPGEVTAVSFAIKFLKCLPHPQLCSWYIFAHFWRRPW